jgi:hypothetical protein
MKQPEYTEGPKALENFERGMKALFKAPKLDIVPRKKQPKAPIVRKKKEGDSGKA